MGNCICIHNGKDTQATQWPAGALRTIPSGHMVLAPSVKRSLPSWTPSTTPRSPLVRYMEPRAVLELACETCGDRDRFPSVDPQSLAALAMACSGGHAGASTWADDVVEARLGLCQMTLSTATWLARELGYDDFGAPTTQQLLEPRTALYFAAAYLQHLSHYGSCARDLTFVIKAYRSGAKEALAQSGPAACSTSANMRDSLTHGGAPPPPAQADTLFWLSYIKALRHFGALRALERSRGGKESGFPPMHVVRPGETLTSIARACEATVAAVVAVNPELREGAQLAAGDCIALPCASQPRLHFTLPGDTVASVARRYEVSVARLLKRNADVAPRYSTLGTGNLLEIPGLSADSLSGSDGSFEDVEAQWPLQGLPYPSGQQRSLITCYRGGRVSEAGFRGIANVRAWDPNLDGGVDRPEAGSQPRRRHHHRRHREGFSPEALQVDYL